MSINLPDTEQEMFVIVSGQSGIPVLIYIALPTPFRLVKKMFQCPKFSYIYHIILPPHQENYMTFTLIHWTEVL